MSSAAGNLSRLRRLEAQRAALAARHRNRPSIVGVARDARVAHLVMLADPLGLPTPRNRRALRVAALMYLAQDRAKTHRKETTQ